MSYKSSSSALLFNVTAQGLFSSQTAFKKPGFADTLNKPSKNLINLLPCNPLKNLAIQQSKPVRILDREEKPEIIIPEPIKKVKIAQQPAVQTPLNLVQTTQQNNHKPSKLTIEDVFDTPVTSKGKKGGLVDDLIDEGSSLSFISSSSSLDSLDDEVIEAEGGKAIGWVADNALAAQNQQVDTQSLVVKDDVISCFNCLEPGNSLPVTFKDRPIFYPSDQFNHFQTLKLLKSLHKEKQYDNSNSNGLRCDIPLTVSYNGFQEYLHQQAFSFNPILAGNIITQLFNPSHRNAYQNQSTQEEDVKNRVNICEEEGYDSDSYATRSTGVEHDSTNQDNAESFVGDKSQKGASPPYNVSESMNEEEKTQYIGFKGQSKKQKETKPRETGKKEPSKPKAKKGRSLNLRLDINPKQLKVERRLNRLQLLRYQQEPIEDDEEIKKFGILELLSRTNSTTQDNNETSMNTIDSKIISTEIQQTFQKLTPEESRAVIPVFGPENTRRRRLVFNSVSKPGDIQENELEGFLKELTEVLEMQVTNQEIAIKLLKTFDMNTTTALETVKVNKGFYKELLRTKVRRLRRYGAI